MKAPRVVSSDEQDSPWECESPRFRVYLQVACDEDKATPDVIDADLLKVLEWPNHPTDEDQTCAVAVVIDDGTSSAPGLIWIVGMDANRQDPRAAGMESRR